MTKQTPLSRPNLSVSKLRLIFSISLIIALELTWLMFLVQSVKAATLSNVMVRFDRMGISEPTTGTVCSSVVAANGTEASVKVTFPTGYSVSTTTGDWTVSTSNLSWPSGGAAWPGIATATTVAGQNVTFPSSNITSDGLYCFNWTNTAALTTKSSATNNNTGVVTTQASGPTTIDSGSYATATVGSDQDQIVVSASVNATFSFALSGFTDNLGALDTSSVSGSPTPRTATISTNALNGWIAWAKDDNAGLSSVTASHTIPSTTPGSNSTLSAGTEGYNLGIQSTAPVDGDGTITIATAYVRAGTNGRGGGLDGSLRTIASADGTTDQAIITLHNHAAISGVTPAASDYTDIITIIAAGLF